MNVIWYFLGMRSAKNKDPDMYLKIERTEVALVQRQKQAMAAGHYRKDVKFAKLSLPSALLWTS